MLSGSEILSEIQALEGHTERVWSVAWSPSGKLLASCSSDKTVRIWSRKATQERWQCSAILEEQHTRTIRHCSWSPDERFLAVASFDATTSIWELQDGIWENVGLLEGHENEVKCVAWSPTGNLIATCSRDKSVWIWEALPGNEYECVDVKQGHSQDVKMVAWHPHGEVLVSASYDDSLKVWRESGDEWECAETISGAGLGHSSTVWAVAFNRDGSLLASCSDDLTVKIWDFQISKGLPRLRLSSSISGYHKRPIFSVDWSPEGLLATGSGDNAIRIFREEEVVSQDVNPGKGRSYGLAASKEEAHDGDVNCVQWSKAEAGLLASAGDDGLVRIWRVQT